MEKQQARDQNKSAVMFCHEGKFLTFYDMDALIVNHLCGYKIIPSGTRPKAGVPLSNTLIFTRLERENISYFVYKKDSGILRDYTSKDNKYEELNKKLLEGLKNRNTTVERYFTKLHTGRNNKSVVREKLTLDVHGLNSSADLLAIENIVATANDRKFDSAKSQKKVAAYDKELELVTSVPIDGSDLQVFTAVKKLTTYIVLVTQKSPKSFRGSLVYRMQNYCFDALEHLFAANGINIRSQEEFEMRKSRQDSAMQKLKLLSYIGMVAESIACILPRQYKQISILLADSINLLSAWRKSDAERWHASAKKLE